MGIVWEAYHKGVPSLGVPENPIDFKILWGTIQFTPTMTLGFLFLAPGRARHPPSSIQIWTARRLTKPPLKTEGSLVGFQGHMAFGDSFGHEGVLIS